MNPLGAHPFTIAIRDPIVPVQSPPGPTTSTRSTSSALKNDNGSRAGFTPFSRTHTSPGMGGGPRMLLGWIDVGGRGRNTCDMLINDAAFVRSSAQSRLVFPERANSSRPTVIV